ncbi:MAG: lamin tail domain-containing protein, partial [Pirellulales bacterium]
DPRLPGGSVRPDAQIYNPTTALVDATSAGTTIVPTGDASESDWQTIGFDDATWNPGQAGIGFDTGASDSPIDVPDGFTVREVHSIYQVDAVVKAENALAGQDVSSETTTAGISVINLHDSDVISSNFELSQPFPGGGGNQFVIEATGTMVVNVPGTYTFGMAVSKGGWLKIDGTDVIEAYATGSTNKFGTVSLTAGPHEVEYVMFENHDRAKAEFFVAPGEFDAFTDDFFLVGDGSKPFAPHIETDVLADMRSVGSSLYLRVPFLVENVEDAQRLTLNVRYDDGFVAYLNGTEIARRNAPDQLDASSAATERRKDIDAVVRETIDLSGFQDLLRNGDNVLAIQGLNVTADDDDFLVAPELTVQRFGEPIRLTGTLDLMARTKRGDDWSAPSRTNYVLADSEDDVTGLAITEVHYRPTDPTGEELAIDPAWTADDFEFIELSNTSDHTMDLAGVMLTDGVEFTFPTGDLSRLEPGDYVLVVQNVEAFQARHGAGLPVAGVFAAGRLNDRGERITLSDRFGSVIQEFAYGTKAPWPERADGIGSSLEVIDTVGDYNQPSNWLSSSEYEGSPGAAGRGAAVDILVNEVLSRSGDSDLDRIELANTTDQAIDVSGWLLSNDPAQLDAHRIPAGTVVPAGGYVSLSSSQTGLLLDGQGGDEVWLVEPTPDARPMRFVDNVEFDGSHAGVSLGRWLDADPQSVLFPMAEQTFGQENTGPVLGDVVLSEVDYHPADVAAVSEDFDQGSADRFTPVQGAWTVVDGRYQVVPGTEGDTISIMETETANTRNVLISTTLQLPAESTFNRNGAILFDYRNPTDFKFASVHGGGKWRIGQRTAGGWDFLAQGERKLSAETDLFVSVEIRGSMVVLRSETSVVVSYDFGEPLGGGQIGLGSKNGEALFDDVVVDPLTRNEDFEFVELFNTSGSIVDLSGWQLDSGIQWTAAEGTSLGPGEALAIVRFDPDDAARSGEFRRVLGIDESVELIGPYAGKLANSGETVRLLEPLEPLEAGDPERGMTLVDRLAYEDQSPWPVTPDGGGHSLHRTTVDAFGGFVSSFRPLEPSPGSELFVLAGDLDLNGIVDDGDVAGLVLALNDPAAYEAT